ncbi:MAG: MAPEG family protein [Xanthomonadales bacterium]|nr:MAPEG family protein [Xanthomonadales bacterium]MDH4020823.1 MAPEG family protein [Xanthomonadales bacterium]
MNEVSIELTMLLWASILYVAQILVAALAADIQNGVAWGLGNRSVIPEVPGWGGRAQRAHVNMAESLLPFACLVLIAYSSGRMGELSALGVQLFLISRLAYALLYIGGVKVLRSLAYFGGLIGMGMIVVQVL